MSGSVGAGIQSRTDMEGFVAQWNHAGRIIIVAGEVRGRSNTQRRARPCQILEGRVHRQVGGKVIAGHRLQYSSVSLVCFSLQGAGDSSVVGALIQTVGAGLIDGIDVVGRRWTWQWKMRLEDYSLNRRRERAIQIRQQYQQIGCPREPSLRVAGDVPYRSRSIERSCGSGGCPSRRAGC